MSPSAIFCGELSSVPGHIAFSSQLDSLDGPWTWFIACHVGCCQWTLVTSPQLCPLCSALAELCPLGKSTDWAGLPSAPASWPFVEQPCFCHSLIYGSSYCSELPVGYTKKYFHNMQEVSSADPNWLLQSGWFMWCFISSNHTFRELHLKAGFLITSADKTLVSQAGYPENWEHVFDMHVQKALQNDSSSNTHKNYVNGRNSEKKGTSSIWKCNMFTQNSSQKY